jgi:hypothetical protein
VRFGKRAHLARMRSREGAFRRVTADDREQDELSP